MMGELVYHIAVVCNAILNVPGIRIPCATISHKLLEPLVKGYKRATQLAVEEKQKRLKSCFADTKDTDKLTRSASFVWMERFLLIRRIVSA